MTDLKLIGEFNCLNCNKPIKIDSNVGICRKIIGEFKPIKIDSSVGICDKDVWNKEEIKCPYCNCLNIITADIRVSVISEAELKQIR